MLAIKERQELSGAMFNLLADAFYNPPTTDKLKLTSSSFENWPDFSGPNTEAIHAIKQSQLNNTIDDFNADYHRLFVGPGKKLVYPWGSYYTDQEGLLFGKTTKAWEDFCHTSDIKITTITYEPTDHFALIFSALSAIQLSEHTEEKKLRLIKTILLEHFSDWGIKVLNLIQEKSNTQYYSAIASLAFQLVNYWVNETDTTLAS
ncbi:TorD/DmsD family molecular chaperone [Shewanella sp. TC10]|uniref:TorD/DmsD family molecular chaperone n=1 Tax=Shewanella sp. TC10 TaxID=1419739 RepID=UPI0018928949|nr:molecular chaperone TorD family protein [Shewanella sp. TC10]